MLYPKIGIRPVIDGRWGGVREALEVQTMGMAHSAAALISENLRYPEECRQSMVQGRVTLQFTVTETGKVADVKVLRGVNPELDKEAVRVVSESPLWTPGKNVKGEIVPISYVFPVIFKLP